MHIAICRLLEPYGFMNSTFWGVGHIIELRKSYQPLKEEQSVLMKEAIVNYFIEESL
jgi:hypothetical protein